MSKKREDPPKKGSPAWTATFGDLMNLLLCFFVMLFSMSTIDVKKYEELRNSFNSDYTSFLSGGTSVLNNSNANDTPSVMPNEHSSDATGDKDENEHQASAEEIEEAKETIQEQKEQYSQKMYKEVSDMLSEQELDSGVVDLKMDKEYNYVMMTLSGNLLFDSGETELNEKAIPVLSKIGDILNMFAGYQIEIIGHTDNVPVTAKNLPYRDNIELSSDRALSTFYYLMNEKGLDPTTLKCSGKGQYDPIATNTSAEGRKKNRRVEIKIYNELSNQ